jgi:N-acetylneuraminate lyase
MHNLQGIIPALVTPFDDDLNIAGKALEALLERMYSAGCDGVYVNGNTGEGLLQTVATRKQVTEIVLAASPKGKSVIVHVGAARPADAFDLARHARSMQATAISSLPPLGGYSYAEIRAYYESLSAAADLPVLVYYFPEVAPSINRLDQVLDLCSIPGVIGLKFTDFDLYRLERIKRSGYVVFNGRDEVLAAGLLMGADGGIGTFYNLVPELFVGVRCCALTGKWSEAMKLQERINSLIELSLKYPPFAAVKEMLGWTGVNCGHCLPPRRALTKEEQAGLRSDLIAAGFSHLQGS